jgi:hypothetical protein
MNRLLSVLLVAMLGIGSAILPRPANAAETEADEEGFSAYSVARIKIFQGTAWIRSPDSGEWQETTTNTPITEKTRVNIPEGSEAELQFHGGQFVLLTGGTEADINKLDEADSAFRLRSGEIRFDLPSEDFSPVRVTVPGGGKTNFNVPGRYWLTVQDEGQTRLVVRSGESAVSVERGDYSVKAGEAATIGQDVRIAAYSGTAEDQDVAPPPLTEEEREAEVPPAAAYELRDYGEWVESSDYGYVWRPQVAAGWSPYYYGRWNWVSPYGWTWVSYEPWGWYPYHFGWWWNDPFFGWVWSPFHSFVSFSFAFGHTHFTHFHRNAFFFPANVRFARDGRNVRWVPLRPGERFVRSGLTRTDARLARFDRPLERGAVFARTERSGKREWREWSGADRDRRSVVVRERSGRGGEEAVRGKGPRGGERATVRPQTERSRPDRPERQERVQPRGFDRPERIQQRDRRGGDGGRFERGASSSPRRQGTESAARPERVRTPRSERPGTESSIRTDRARPSRSERVDRRGTPRREYSPVRERREAPSFRSERARPAPPARDYGPSRGYSRPDKPQRSFVPDRGSRQSDRGAMSRPPEGRGDSRGQNFRSPPAEGRSDGRGGGGGGRFEFGGRDGGNFGGRGGGNFGGGRR